MCTDVRLGVDLKALPPSAFEWPVDLPIPHLVRSQFHNFFIFIYLLLPLFCDLRNYTILSILLYFILFYCVLFRFNFSISYFYSYVYLKQVIFLTVKTKMRLLRQNIGRGSSLTERSSSRNVTRDMRSQTAYSMVTGVCVYVCVCVSVCVYVCVRTHIVCVVYLV